MAPSLDLGSKKYILDMSGSDASFAARTPDDDDFVDFDSLTIDANKLMVERDCALISVSEVSSIWDVGVRAGEAGSIIKK